MSVPPELVKRLREYAGAAYGGTKLPVAAIRSELSAIEDESIRRGAMDRFHILTVCSTVMRMDPANYQRSVKKACDNLLQFLEAPHGAASIEPAIRSTARNPRLAQRPAVTGVRAQPIALNPVTGAEPGG